jgi:hypothetical protein
VLFDERTDVDVAITVVPGAGTMIFAESFDTSAAMSLLPVFNEDRSGDYFGLTGGAISDFGPDWDGDLNDLNIMSYTGEGCVCNQSPVYQALTAAIL